MAAIASEPDHERFIMSRIIQPRSADLSAAAARALLKLKFDPSDRERMHELALKAQNGELSQAEELELDEYRRAGRLLDLLHSKARLSLKKLGKTA